MPNKRLDMSNAMATDFRRLFPPETRHPDLHGLDRGCTRSGPLALARQLENLRAFDELPFLNIPRVEFDPANDAVIHVTAFGGSVWRGPDTAFGPCGPIPPHRHTWLSLEPAAAGLGHPCGVSAVRSGGAPARIRSYARRSRRRLASQHWQA